MVAVYVQAFYVATNGGSDAGLNFPPSAPSNTIVVTAPLPTLTPSVTATVAGFNDPAYGSNYEVLIRGSNFAKGEEVAVTVTWTIAGEEGGIFRSSLYRYFRWIVQHDIHGKLSQRTLPYRGRFRAVSARANFSNQRYGIEYTKDIFCEGRTVYLSPCLSVRGKAAEKPFNTQSEHRRLSRQHFIEDYRCLHDFRPALASRGNRDSLPRVIVLGKSNFLKAVFRNSWCLSRR